MVNENTISTLLERGLYAYGQGELRSAVEQWHEVLLLDPGNSLAVDYLQSAGQQPSVVVPRPTSNEKNPSMVEEFYDRLKELLVAKEYSKALELLVQAKRNDPQNAALGRAIQRVKEKYVVVLVRELGKLDQLVRRQENSDELDEAASDSEVRSVVEHIDNETSVGDIIKASALEKHTVLEILVRLRSRNGIELVSPSFALPLEIAGAQSEDVARTLYSSAPASVSASVDSPGDNFDMLFRDATRAYVNGDLERALALFERCHVLRPDSERTRHNIERLRRSIQ